MPSTLAQYNALLSARNSGALRVTVENRTTEYRSLADLMQVLALMKGELEGLGLLPLPTGPSRRTRVVTTKGL